MRPNRSSMAPLCLAAALVSIAPASVGAQQFASAVSAGDDVILISEIASVQDAAATAPKTIHVYERGSSGWEKTGSLMAPGDGGADYFGRVVLMDDRSLLVSGTVYEESRGAVWAYERVGDEWAFDAIVRGSEVQPGSSFGRFAALSGDDLFVSSLAHGGAGTVWTFERDASGSWVETARLTAEGGPRGELFGWGMDSDGERLVVGAVTQGTWRGAAYVFVRDETAGWVQEARLELPEAERVDGEAIGANSLQVSVALYDGNVLLGLPGSLGTSGAVYGFERRAGTGEWARSLTLAAFDPQAGGAFGYELEPIDGGLWVTAPGADGYGVAYEYAYDAGDRSFRGARKVAPTIDTDAGDAFGMTLSLRGDLAVVGQPADDKGLGSALVLERRDGDWVSAAKLFIPEERRDLSALSDVSCGDDGMADQFTCSEVDVLSFMPLDEIGGEGRGIETNDVWGWTDPQTGREYAIVGRTNGTSFIDISDPSAPVFLGELPKTRGSITNSWRDVKVYRNHAFIVADNAGDHGMQVFDLTRLRDVRDAPATFDEDAIYRNIASAHNIIINEETGVAYTVGGSSGGETCGGGLHMIDIADPLQPSFLGCFQEHGTGRGGTGNSHDAQCVNYHGPDADYTGREICFAANETALAIADVSDKDNPQSVSVATYPAVAYTHQGWLTEDHRYFYVNDELDEQAAVNAGTEADFPGSRTLIWDLTDLDDPVLAKEHFGETFTIDHNLYIVGDRMYQSNYVSGLRVLDISDRENPREVGFFDTVPWDESVTFDGSWSNYPFFESGTIVVSSGKEGVFFLKYRQPELVP
ncbi:MAG: choice-of-anchor B family protein [Gemmatimonadetes bacterium]|nr:choice-of-anchor B family protein [Gemmatimonadota bacterium]